MSTQPETNAIQSTPAVSESESSIASPSDTPVEHSSKAASTPPQVGPTGHFVGVPLIPGSSLLCQALPDGSPAVQHVLNDTEAQAEVRRILNGRTLDPAQFVFKKHANMLNTLRDSKAQEGHQEELAPAKGLFPHPPETDKIEGNSPSSELPQAALSTPPNDSAASQSSKGAATPHGSSQPKVYAVGIPLIPGSNLLCQVLPDGSPAVQYVTDDPVAGRRVLNEAELTQLGYQDRLWRAAPTDLELKDDDQAAAQSSEN